MDYTKLHYFKEKLLHEKNRIKELIDDMKKNQISDMYDEMADELSTFDNHPGDIGSIRSDLARGAYAKENELSILRQVDDALHAIDEGNYGKCKICGNVIAQDRLEAIPYATSCVHCKSELIKF